MTDCLPDLLTRTANLDFGATLLTFFSLKYVIFRNILKVILQSNCQL